MSDQIVVLKISELSGIISSAADLAVEKAIKRLPKADQPRPFHLNQTQAAEVLGVSKATVSRMVRSGTFTLNSCGMIPIAQIDRALGR